MTVHADAALYAGLFDGDERPQLALDPGARPTCTWCAAHCSVNGQALAAGDAALLRGEAMVELTQGSDAEVLVFDLAP